jgi:hypothetical protein
MLTSSQQQQINYYKTILNNLNAWITEEKRLGNHEKANQFLDVYIFTCGQFDEYLDKNKIILHNE